MLSRPALQIINLTYLRPAAFFIPPLVWLLSVAAIAGATYFSYFYTLLLMFENRYDTQF
jgi:hypothetical protein